MTRNQRRRAENEVVFRQRNEDIRAVTKEMISDVEHTDPLMPIICECSNEDCRETLELPLSTFEKARKNNRQFIIKPGHEHADIERVIHRNGYVIVEKFEQPPVTNGILNTT